MSMDEILFLVAQESQVNDIVTGVYSGSSQPWSYYQYSKIGRDEVGVVAKASRHSDHIQPLVFVVPDEAQKRLFTRFASLRSEFSPLTSWGHIVNRRLFEHLEETKRVPSFSNLVASWSGLVVAEAVLLAGRSPDKLKIASCFATATFAVARAVALWPSLSVADIREKYYDCNRLIRGGATPNLQVTKRLEPIWMSLLEAGEGAAYPSSKTTSAILALQQARENRSESEHLALHEVLSAWPEFSFLKELDTLGPEDRVHLFDHLMNELRSSRKVGERQELLAFAAAYVTTIAAGGTPSLGLAEQVANDWPEVLAWAYVIGGVGERVLWTSSFVGLGRLIWRELSRPLYLDEPPTCDFAFDEAMYLVDRQLSDPLVHLKVKQQRLLSVALYPGVNISVPLPDAVEQTSNPNRANTPPRASRELDQLVNALWPLIEDRLSEEGYTSAVRSGRAGASSRKKAGQARLPLDK
ncbi:hypothetical protein K7A42_17165 [Agrobacterium sp. InxBP2]|uniref:hypothetical protein n=1 Tax=Agrobacterium sp. InxBP2 TaxID=2870329 RepID=UPI00249EAFFA|nr:hypothetical protein [Agrobacterium sp. InxBP2]MCW8282629.1 hypothetical protein [Agrobacterium sp. InxBP2]